MASVPSSATWTNSGIAHGVESTAGRSTAQLNIGWCRVIVSELVKLGMRDVVISPGARSAAMVVALGERPELRLFVQTDERSAGFFACGLSRVTNRAVAVCTTSGSAVANVVPALTEAQAVGLPLVLLSCDRPRYLRGSGLPQTTEQVAFCAPLIETGLDLDDPSLDPARLRYLADAVGELGKFLSPGPNRGPVQINVPLIGTLCSTEEGQAAARDLIEHRQPFYPYKLAEPLFRRSNRSDAISVVNTLALRRGMRGLIVCGPEWAAALSSIQLRELAERTGFPLLADAPGSARSLGIDGLVAEADVLVLQPDLQAPDLVIRIGLAPISHTVQVYLQRAQCTILISRRPVAADFIARKFEQLICPDDDAMYIVYEALGQGAVSWKERWRQASIAARSQLLAAVTACGWSEVQVAAEVSNHKSFKLAHVANSLSIRLFNFLVEASHDQRMITANRGVSGIDGTISTFLGELSAQGGPGVLLIGDLAMLHDLPALEACIHQNFSGAIVIVNNSGAGLFDLMSLSSISGYAKLIRNTRTLVFEGIAESFNMGYIRCRTQKDMREALSAAIKAEQIVIIDAIVPPDRAKATLPTLLNIVLQT